MLFLRRKKKAIIRFTHYQIFWKKKRKKFRLKRKKKYDKIGGGSVG